MRPTWTVMTACPGSDWNGSWKKVGCAGKKKVGCYEDYEDWLVVLLPFRLCILSDGI